MRKALLALFALCAALTTRASGINSSDGIVKFSVKALSETYLGDLADLDKGPWYEDKSSSTVIIDWDKKVIEMKENNVLIEGPYRIISIGEEYRDTKNRPSVVLMVDEGYGGEEMATEFIIVVTEGKSVKEMEKGYLFQIFEPDVYGYDLFK